MRAYNYIMSITLKTEDINGNRRTISFKEKITACSQGDAMLIVQRTAVERATAILNTKAFKYEIIKQFGFKTAMI